MGFRFQFASNLRAIFGRLQNPNKIVVSRTLSFYGTQSNGSYAVVSRIQKQNDSNGKWRITTGTSLTIGGLMSFLKGENKDETPEDKLIMTIKRGILCIQREQYDKAEQMLHVALKMAQDLQNRDGVVYIYDTLANLAMQNQQFAKAEKLFVSVMQYLMGAGTEETDIKMLHISTKIAQMALLQQQLDKANTGFKYVLSKIENRLEELKDNPDLFELYGLAKKLYSDVLIQQEKFQEAKDYLLQAFETYKKLHGEMTNEAVLMLNDLAAVCLELNLIEESKKYLERAFELAKEIRGFTELAVLQATQGMLLLRQGLLEEAKSACKLAWSTALNDDNEEAKKQASYCLEVITELLKGGTKKKE